MSATQGGNPGDGRPQRTGDGRLPGDMRPEKEIARFIRVDHAGEYGAKRIYEGQLAILGRTDKAPLLRHMADQEAEHLAYFEQQLRERRVRPTALTPVWHVAGFALGAATALLGERAAMACTVAVEETIDDHYEQQARKLGRDEDELHDTIRRFQAEEVEHKDIGLEHGAEQALAYPLLSGAIKAGTRLAIWLSERV